ncbi:MAG: hypothetical protein LM558_00170 [Thermosphaera sp.]|nr:hypothetical protein [Thermosphaera sp.]
MLLEKWRSLSSRERAERMEKAVSDILERFPIARNNDLYLTILVLRYCTPLGKHIDHVPYELIKEFDGILEAIRRTRQKLNERGLYLPTDPSVLERRRKKAQKMKRAVSQASSTEWGR